MFVHGSEEKDEISFEKLDRNCRGITNLAKPQILMYELFIIHV